MTTISTTPGLIQEISSIESQKLTYQALISKLELELQESELVKRINKGKQMLKEAQEKEIEIKKQGVQILQKAGIDKFEANGVEVRIKKTTGALIIDDESKIDKEYIKEVVKTTKSVDKKAIKEDLKEGVIIEGVHIEKKVTLEFKIK